MADNIEVETKELQEAIHEIHEEQARREEEEKRARWTKYIGLTTAILAVFAAIGALRSSNLVNEAMIHRVMASDTWNEYQASRQKDHLYTIFVNSLVDANAANPKVVAAGKASPAKTTGEKTKGAPSYVPKDPAARVSDYKAQILSEMAKENERSKEARKLETESTEELHKHHFFEYCVALIQVAIALGAVAALSRNRWVWYLSMVAGAIGLGVFFAGFFA